MMTDAKSGKRNHERMTIARGHTWLAAVLTVCCVSAGYPQAQTTNQAPAAPDFTVQVWGFIVADFSARVLSYFELRSMLQEGVPALVVTENPAEFKRAERLLAAQIRGARKGARQGDIFTPAISLEFKKALLLEMNASTLNIIMDDNPGEFWHEINGNYPKSKPFSTVPANVLALLPVLPADIEYRFLGRHLILYDIRANVIIDRIPCAVQLLGGDEVTCERLSAHHMPLSPSGSR